ncbi:MAG: molecular chaperone HtpG [Lachnospirales bacterium]
MEKGNISIHSENFLPIIKKWLYSDTDIFVRELVSNGADAVNKFKKLVDLGEAAAPDSEDYKITVYVDKEKKQIIFEDNGIGMTAEEVKKYINEIAFSGATDFMNKYNESGAEEGNDIIGHFGLGFYSAFMVAATVEIDTLSYLPDSTPAKWVCDGGIEYEIGEGTRSQRGTTITLNVMEEEESFLEPYKIREILNKYCRFIPVDIYFEEIKPEEDKNEVVDEEGNTVKEGEETEVVEPTPINNKTPLWSKKPSDCTDDDYKAFYRDVFMDFNEPLFWIHLNMDYPFRLQGILYFPKLNHELESIEGQVKLYNNQVFIADNIKEVIPEFLLLLKGTIDCPDLPLNVSRSFLQNDGYVTKMSQYITKKVADKLNSIFKKDREKYNNYWDNISPFVKYGCIREKDFYDKVKDSLVFKTVDNEYLTINEYMDNYGEKTEKKIYYATNKEQQASYIKMYKDIGIESVVLEARIDNPFVSYLENYDRDIKFMRIDSDITNNLKDEGEVEESFVTDISEVFKKALNNENLDIKVENLKDESIPAIVLLSEESRRMEEMQKMFGASMMGMGMPTNSITLLLNKKNSLVNHLLDIKNNEDGAEDTKIICEHLYDLALMSHKPLSTDGMNKFIARSNMLLTKLAGIK